MWVYHSQIGNLFIKPLPDGKYALEYDGEILESCHSPRKIADNVYCHCTGCYEWDKLDGLVIGPSDLSEWEEA